MASISTWQRSHIRTLSDGVSNIQPRLHFQRIGTVAYNKSQCLTGKMFNTFTSFVLQAEIYKSGTPACAWSQKEVGERKHIGIDHLIAANVALALQDQLQKKTPHILNTPKSTRSFILLGRDVLAWSGKDHFWVFIFKRLKNQFHLHLIWSQLKRSNPNQFWKESTEKYFAYQFNNTLQVLTGMDRVSIASYQCGRV